MFMVLVLLAGVMVTAQPVHNTFTSTRIVGSQSNETLRKRILEFRVTHRFGNMADSQAVHTLFGLDEAEDIRIALEYGITDNLMIGAGRSKGAYQRKGIIDAFAKYKLLQQSADGKVPLGITLNLAGGLSTMKRSQDSTKITSFPRFAHRGTYVAQAIITRKFYDRFSLALLPTFIHRNFVLAVEKNDVMAVGVAARFRFYKQFALLVDYSYPVTRFGGADTSQVYNHPLGIGLELETGGHIFTITFINSEGIIEQEFIPQGGSSWLDGQFRFGFTIARKFKV
jgi:hypothetical protein